MLNSDTSQIPHGTIIPTRLPISSWATTPSCTSSGAGEQVQRHKTGDRCEISRTCVGDALSRFSAPATRFQENCRPGLRNARVAVFVDGCFWHGCPERHAPPRTNATYWATKIQGNRSRDEDTTERLRKEGWTVLRFWSHEEPLSVATQIAKVVATNIRAANPSLKGRHDVND